MKCTKIGNISCCFRKTKLKTKKVNGDYSMATLHAQFETNPIIVAHILGSAQFPKNNNLRFEKRAAKVFFVYYILKHTFIER